MQMKGNGTNQSSGNPSGAVGISNVENLNTGCCSEVGPLIAQANIERAKLYDVIFESI